MIGASSRRARRHLRNVSLVFVAACVLAFLPAASALALDDEPDDQPGARLGFGSYETPSGGLLGFLDRDRLSHSRSLAFGMAMTNGGPSENVAGATYSDYFAYRLRENLTMNLALRYNFVSTFRSSQEERGQFSVLPSFALEYHPSPSTAIQFSYGRFGGGYPFLSGRPYFPY